MNIPQQFTDHVDECLDQAVAEGWVVSRNTAATVAVTIGVLIARFESVDDGTMLMHARHFLQQALEFVA